MRSTMPHSGRRARIATGPKHRTVSCIWPCSSCFETADEYRRLDERRSTMSFAFISFNWRRFRTDACMWLGLRDDDRRDGSSSAIGSGLIPDMLHELCPQPLNQLHIFLIGQEKIRLSERYAVLSKIELILLKILPVISKQGSDKLHEQFHMLVRCHSGQLLSWNICTVLRQTVNFQHGTTNLLMLYNFNQLSLKQLVQMAIHRSLRNIGHKL